MCALLTAVCLWPRLDGFWRQPAFLVYMASLFVGAMSQFWVAVFLLPLTMLAVASPAPRRRAMIAAHAGVVISVGAFLTIKLIRGDLSAGEGFLRPFTALESWMLFFNWFLHGNTIAPVNPYRHTWSGLVGNPALLCVQLLAAGLCLRGVLARQRLTMPAVRWELFLLVSALPLTMGALTLVGYDRLYIERYVIMALPFFAIAVARGVTTLSPPSVRRVAAGAVLSLGIAAYSLLLTTSAQWTVYKANPDWRGAVQWVRESTLRSDRVLVLTAVHADDLKWYVRRLIPGRTVDVLHVDAAGIDRLWAERRLDTMSTIVLANNTVWRGQFDRVVARLQEDPRLHPAGVAVFKAVEIHMFVHRDPLAAAGR
jgi:hypothetical protein